MYYKLKRLPKNKFFSLLDETQKPFLTFERINNQALLYCKLSEFNRLKEILSRKCIYKIDGIYVKTSLIKVEGYWSIGLYGEAEDSVKFKVIVEIL